jgi:hypothetical protein
MKTFRTAALIGLLCTAATAKAQDGAPAAAPELQAMMEAWQKAATPGPQHRQLAEHFAGTWTTKSTMWMDPSAPPMTETGRSTHAPVLGGRQLRMDFAGQFMGQPFEGVGYTGFDNVRGKYVGSWMDNVSTGQFMAEGDYDPTTRTYTFRGEMADPMQPGKTTAVREVVRIVDNDHHVMEWYETHDGAERKSMRIEYTREK